MVPFFILHMCKDVMGKCKSIISCALALGMCANSFLMAEAVGSDDESDSDGINGTSSSTHTKAKEKKIQRKPVMPGSHEVHRELVAIAAPRNPEVAAAVAPAGSEE